MDQINYKVDEYYDGLDQLPAGATKISPSGVERFFSEKVQWYKEVLLGEPKKFTGNTSTVLGTLVHKSAEIVATSLINKVPYDSAKLKEEAQIYIDSYKDREDYDTSKIETLWHGMAEALIKEYVINTNTLKVEDYISHEIIPGVWAGGTYDAITSTAPTDTWQDVLDNKHVGVLTVRDYKTAGSKPSSFTWAYKLQAFTYAYILKQQGITIDRVELCFVIPPTKTLPIRTFNFVQEFNSIEYDIIDGILHVIADSIKYFKEYPECRYLLMSDYRMKLPESK
jgi:hypothetical protein